jgi:hypothetical protein
MGRGVETPEWKQKAISYLSSKYTNGYVADLLDVTDKTVKKYSGKH